MADVPIPFTGEAVDTDDGAVPIVMTIGLLVVGFGIFAMARQAGNNLYQKGSRTFAQYTGMELDGSDSSDPAVV